MLTRRELLIGGAALAACASGRKQQPVAETRRRQAGELMDRFAERTGVTGAAAQRRYLWTDAYAVGNFVALGRPELAATLVARVHEVLAPSRDPAHPTAAGLRIGKPQPERRADEPYDDEREWDRDGQYFHYLTKWMSALAQMKHMPWACDLAQVAHRAFVYGAKGQRRMYWKMSVDLSRAQVASMGQHDPLDGYVTYRSLTGCDLAAAIADFDAM